MNYTHVITFYKREKFGWTYNDIKATKNSVPVLLKDLYKQQVSGNVRLISSARL